MSHVSFPSEKAANKARRSAMLATASVGEKKATATIYGGIIAQASDAERYHLELLFEEAVLRFAQGDRELFVLLERFLEKG